MKKLSFKLFGVWLLAMLGLWVIGLSTTGTAYADNYGSDSPVWTVGGSFGDTQEATSWLGVAGAWTKASWGFIQIIKNFINWTLGILWLIALIVLLYGWFSMVTAAGDEEKYKKWFKILQQAAVGLIFIGISFFIVSVILRLVGKVWGAPTGWELSWV